MSLATFPPAPDSLYVFDSINSLLTPYCLAVLVQSLGFVSGVCLFVCYAHSTHAIILSVPVFGACAKYFWLHRSTSGPAQFVRVQQSVVEACVCVLARA